MKMTGNCRLTLCLFLAAMQPIAANAATPPVVAPLDLNTGLVAYFPFNGNANDESGTGNNGTVNGPALTTDRLGLANKAYLFDGIDDYIRTTDSQSLNLTSNLSISAWIRSTTSSQNQSIIFSNMLEISPHSGYQVRFTPTGSLRFMSGDQSIFGNKVVSSNSWAHVAATLTGTTARLYVNGVLDVSGTVGVPTSSSVDQTIGSSYSPFYFFKGGIDDVRVYNRALTASEVQQLALLPEPSSIVVILSSSAVLLRRRSRSDHAT